jgi:replicative DNA helicase
VFDPFAGLGTVPILRGEARPPRPRRRALPVVVFSMEMSGSSSASACSRRSARVDAHKLRTGNLNDEEWSSLTEAMGVLHAAPIHIDDGGALTALEVRARARRVKRQYSKLGLVVVDYLQLMESKSQGENRATEISRSAARSRRSRRSSSAR